MFGGAAVMRTVTVELSVGEAFEMVALHPAVGPGAAVVAGEVAGEDVAAGDVEAGAGARVVPGALVAAGWPDTAAIVQAGPALG